MWWKIKKRIKRLFIYKPIKYFYFEDRKYGSWVSVYFTDYSEEYHHVQFSDYVSIVALMCRRGEYYKAFLKAFYFYKNHRHDKYYGEKRFVFQVERQENVYDVAKD